MNVWNKLKSEIAFRLSDYYFISYPKCGRTWIRYFLGRYYSHLYSVEQGPEFPSFNKIHSGIPGIIFSHGPFLDVSREKMTAYLSRFKERQVINLIRDPRDVVVSSFYHHKFREKRDDLKGVDISEFIRSQKYGIYNIITHINTTLDKRSICKRFLLIRYEDLKADSQEEFRKLLRYLDAPVDEEILIKSDEESSLENMKKKQKRGEFDNERLKNPSQSEKTAKIRKGESGGYSKELNDDDIAYVNTVIQELNHGLGYS